MTTEARPSLQTQPSEGYFTEHYTATKFADVLGAVLTTWTLQKREPTSPTYVFENKNMGKVNTLILTHEKDRLVSASLQSVSEFPAAEGPHIEMNGGKINNPDSMWVNYHDGTATFNGYDEEGREKKLTVRRNGVQPADFLTAK